MTPGTFLGPGNPYPNLHKNHDCILKSNFCKTKTPRSSLAESFCCLWNYETSSKTTNGMFLLEKVIAYRPWNEHNMFSPLKMDGKGSWSFPISEGLHPLKSNMDMEPENTNLGKGERSRNHQFLGFQPLVSGGVCSGDILVVLGRVWPCITLIHPDPDPFPNALYRRS